MKPAQKIIVSCRQTADAARRVCEWLETTPEFLGDAERAVIEDIEGLVGGLSPIAIAAEMPPVIGVIGTTASGKTELVMQLLGPRGPGDAGDFAGRPVDPQTLRHILPSDDREGGALAIRLTTAPLATAPRGFPVRIGLLSETDIAAIIAFAWLGEARAASALPTPDAIEAMFADAASHMSLQPVPGLAARDAIDLRELLCAEWAGHPFVTALAATRYFDRLREVVAHLEAPYRRRLLSALWGNDPHSGMLFARLYEALDSLGHGAEAYAGAEALIGKDRLTGWLMRHPQSIADGTTIRAMTRGAPMPMPVMSRYGQTVDIDRAVLAAIASELPLQAGPSRLAELAPAELVDFPATPIAEIAVDPRVGAAPDDAGFAAAVHRFARAKPGYLFQRGCRRREITCLVATVDPSGADDSIGPAITEWVETAQGNSETARERVRRGLFIAAAVPSSAAATDDDGTAARERVLSVLETTVGSGHGWLDHWTPGRAVDDVYWFPVNQDQMRSVPAASSPIARQDGHSPAAIASASTDALQDLPSPHRATNIVSRRDVPAERMATATFVKGASRLHLAREVSEASLSELAAELQDAATPHAKMVQLTRAVAETRRRLRHALVRYYVANDPSNVGEWRRSMAIVACNRLRSITDRGLLGRLLRVLTPTERGLQAAISAARLQAEAAQSSFVVPVPHGSVAIFGEPGARARELGVEQLSAVATSEWIASIIRASRSRHTCRQIGLDGAVLHHIADELQHAAARIGLGQHIASALRHLQPRDAAPDDARIAAYSCRIIAAFVETLSDPMRRGEVAAGPNQLLEVEVAEATGTVYASARRTGAGMQGTRRPWRAGWGPAYAALVDDNIAAANLGSPRGDKDRELGTLIQLFAAGPFEGDV